MINFFLIRANKEPFGGAENYLLRLSEGLTAKGIQHQIIYSKLPKFLPSWLRVILFNLQLKILKGDRFYFSLERISSPDIYRAGDGVHKAFLKTEKKSLFNPLHPVYLFLEKKCFEKSKLIIANSYMIKNEIKINYGVSDEKIRVIYNGYNPQDIDYFYSFNKISKEFNIMKGQPVLLFVGSGFKRKGVADFLRIVSKLKDIKFTALVVGGDKNIEFYKKISKKLMINDKVIFTGPRLDVNHFYNISDIFIFPTHYEPFSNSVLEAMSYGNAVFTSRQNGASEIIDSDFIMRTPKDDSVVDKIRSLFENPSRLAKIKNINLKTSKKFSIEKNVDEVLKVINEVIN